MTSSIVSMGSPAFRPTTSPSHRPSSMKEMTVLPISFIVAAWPISPQ